jgi:hypothetical protein
MVGAVTDRSDRVFTKRLAPRSDAVQPLTTIHFHMTIVYTRLSIIFLVSSFLSSLPLRFPLTANLNFGLFSQLPYFTSQLCATSPTVCAHFPKSKKCPQLTIIIWRLYHRRPRSRLQAASRPATAQHITVAMWTKTVTLRTFFANRMKRIYRMGTGDSNLWRTNAALLPAGFIHRRLYCMRSAITVAHSKTSSCAGSQANWTPI